MHRIRLTTLGVAAAAISALFGMSATVILAQEEVDVDAEVRASTPSEEQIRAFEERFGGPPGSFAETDIGTPSYEAPREISEEVRAFVQEKDLVALYCSMTQWKGGRFVASMDAVKLHLMPAIDVAKRSGLVVTVPDADALRSQGLARIQSVCAAGTADDAKRLAEEFAEWAEREAAEPFRQVRADLQAQARVKSDALRAKVQSAVDVKVAELRSKYEAELGAEADRLAAAKKAEFEAAGKAPTTAQIDAAKAQVRGQVESLAARRKAEAETEIRGLIDDTMGPEKEQLESVGRAFEGMQEKMDSAIEEFSAPYEAGRRDYVAKRKELVFAVLDVKLADGLAKLDAAVPDIEQARAEDPSVPSAAQVRDDLTKDRQALEAKLDAALEAGDEVAFQKAILDFQTKWETYRAEMEKAISGAASKVCTVALAQFQSSRPQMEAGQRRIDELLGKCATDTSEECLKVQEFAGRLGTLSQKLSDITFEMDSATAICQAPETADRQNLIVLMRKIQADAEDAKAYGTALEAEKEKVIADSVKKVCDQVLPQLSAAKVEIESNDLASLTSRLDRCKGKTTAECTAVNAVSGKVGELRNRVDDFIAGTELVAALCQSADEASFTQLRDTLNDLKSQGEALKTLGKELRTEQAKATNPVMLCRAATAQFDRAKAEIATGLRDMEAVRAGCAGKTDDRCRKIVDLAPKFDAVNTQAGTVLAGIAEVSSVCAGVDQGTTIDDVIALLTTLSEDKDALMAAIEDLKKEQDASGRGEGIWIEAEQESASHILSAGSRPAINMKEVRPRWRPPFYGVGDWYLAAGGEWLSYAVTVPATGTYNVWVRDYVDRFQQRGVRRIIIEFDGKRYGVFPEVDIPSPGDKGVFGWHEVGGGVQLSAGNHTMKVTKEATTAGAAILDAFYLTNGDESPPEK